MHVKYTCKNLSACTVIQCSWLLSCTIKHRELTRGCWLEMYTRRYTTIIMQNYWVYIQQKNTQYLPQTANYIYSYIYNGILVQSSSAVLKEIPHHTPLLLIGSVHRAAQVPFRGSQPRSSAQCVGNVLQTPVGMQESKPASGPLDSFKLLVWWEQPVRGIESKVAWSSNPQRACNKHADSQH